MSVKLGMNGFGRIGRYLTRLLADEPEIELAVINARSDNASLAHLLAYDSCHGRFPGVSHNDKGLIVNGREIAVSRQPLGEYDWSPYGVDMVVETTGKMKDRDGLAQHLKGGARKSIISAPGKGVDISIVMGVNHQDYDPAKHDVISNASCTTNCLAPAAKVLNDEFGIVHGLMTTVHSYTMSQRILDGSHKDLRRGRAAAVSMIPTTTGAAKAVTEVIPELSGKLDGMAIRVPTPNVSLVDLTCELARDCTAEEVNAALKAASEGPMQGNLGYSEEPLVSVDYMGSIYGGVVDALTTNVVDKRLCKLIIWYDNEAGFTNQLLRLLKMISKDL
ncbi:MAG: type I glyceraldehyde-3-phosphate dehydrogenase [Oceanidesulfovibrio sp.]